MRTVAHPQAVCRALLHHCAETRVACRPNGDLIRLAEAEFDIFITCDQNIRYQQNLAARRIAILELSTNDLRSILAAGSAVCAAVAAIQPGKYVHLSIP